jgi:hypothetical protein
MQAEGDEPVNRTLIREERKDLPWKQEPQRNETGQDRHKETSWTQSDRLIHLPNYRG